MRRGDRRDATGPGHRDLSRRQFAVAFAILLAAALLRGLFPAADPPWNPTVGIVWHDEGAWVHNARNKALFGAWSPGRVEPDVHRAGVHRPRVRCRSRRFGVGVRQARLVPEIARAGSRSSLLALGRGRHRRARAPA